MNLLKVPGYYGGIISLKDHGLKFSVWTQELASKDKLTLLDNERKAGWFLFSPTGEIKTDDIPLEPIEFEGQKTLSERLRNVLWVLHEKRAGKPEDFETFRQKYMESIISQIKEKISKYDSLN
jgi:hypothetical protein